MGTYTLLYDGVFKVIVEGLFISNKNPYLRLL